MADTKVYFKRQWTDFLLVNPLLQYFMMSDESQAKSGWMTKSPFAPSLKVALLVEFSVITLPNRGLIADSLSGSSGER